MPLDILSLGEPMVELNQSDGAQFRQGFGGDTSNAAIAAARQGTRAGYLSAVGRDAFGDALLDLWKAEGVSTETVSVDPSASTGVYFFTHDEHGHRFSYLRAGSAASRLSLTQAARQSIGDARVLHLSGISQAISLQMCDTCFEAIAIARESGTLVSYDTNLRLALWPLPRARAIIKETLSLCDIALPGHDDAMQITGLDDPDAIADAFLGYGCKLVALTLGSDGAIIATPDERRRIPTLQVEAIDATGAGDAFDGAFLAEYLRTDDPFAAGEYACAAAALSTTGYGAVAPIPRRADVEAALAG
ncbi:MAG TPA: sugar kinase [Saliniramus sp.]|nr:sugar kinase [Saliniramus sp.]